MRKILKSFHNSLNKIKIYLIIKKINKTKIKLIQTKIILQIFQLYKMIINKFMMLILIFYYRINIIKILIKNKYSIKKLIQIYQISNLQMKKIMIKIKNELIKIEMFKLIFKLF